MLSQTLGLRGYGDKYNAVEEAKLARARVSKEDIDNRQKYANEHIEMKIHLVKQP